MRVFRAAIFAALLLFPAGLRAEDVTLTSRDGSVEISGNLLGFDGEFYRVETEFGVLTVDGSSVDCDGPGCPTLGQFVAELTISGARSVGSVVMPALIEGFAGREGYSLGREELAGVGFRFRLYEKDSQREAARVTLRLTDSDEGFADLISGESDMVLAAREATLAEQDMARDAGIGDLRSSRQFRVIARDALVPVVAPTNPVDEIALSALARALNGEIARWGELGGEPAPITPHLIDPKDDLARVFAGRFFADSGAIPKGAAIHQTMRGLTEAVTDDPFGLGLTTLSAAGSAKRLRLSGDCPAKLEATRASVMAGDYPLTVPLFLYLPGRVLPKIARDFLAYLRTTSAQMVIRRSGLVSEPFEEISLDQQGQRLANAILVADDENGLEELKRMARAFSSKARIGLTFRFLGGSTELDAPSRANVEVLASALGSGQFDGHRLHFFGFSDGVGDAAVNLRLSLRRANAVRRAVILAAEAGSAWKFNAVADGFGEALPIACDDTEWGRQLNRRVEVWID